MVEIGVKLRKVVILVVRGCYRSICNHLVLVGMLCFLINLYTTFPFLFSILVSASPVLVCAAAILGILLSYGQLNIPEFEKDEITTDEVVSLKTGFSRDAVVVERNGSVLVEDYTYKGRDIAEKSIEGTSLDANEISIYDFAGRGQLVEERSWEKYSDDRLMEGEDSELEELEYKRRNDFFKGRYGDRKSVTNEYSLITRFDDENLELENDKSPASSDDSKLVNVDSLDSPPFSPWKHEDDQGEEDEDEDDEALDSGSDQAESSSPDASMADIDSMLHELHPLLDDDTPQHADVSHDGSHAASEHSDDDTENQEELLIADDDNEDEEEEEEKRGDKDDQTNSAITWTEEDQKNVMDLGNLELERDQRLEKLIATRKKWSILNEKDLIDLSGVDDLPFNIPLISTIRTNPFDHLHNSYENMGLPPIPGSAPSILVPGRNPFEFSHDSDEDKPDIVEESFQFMSFQPKEASFRRHESFNVRPSLFGSKKPYFVPERLGSEGTSYPTFHRQLSDLSESKASSIPETESLGSSDLEEQNLMDREISLMSNLDIVSEHGGFGSVASEGEDSLGLGQVEKRDVEVEVEVGDVGNHQETRPSLITTEMLLGDESVEKSYSRVLSASSSSEESERIYTDLEAEELPTFTENHHETGPSLVTTEMHLGNETLEHRHSGVSSASSSSEESERMYADMDAEELPTFVENHHETNPSLITTEMHLGNATLEHRLSGVSSASLSSEESERIYMDAEEFPTFVERINHIDEPIISTEPSMPVLHLNIKTAVTSDTPHREPLYDSSPPSVRKNLSASSASSDVHVDSESGLPPVLIKRTISFAKKDSEVTSRDISIYEPSFEESDELLETSLTAEERVHEVATTLPPDSITFPSEVSETNALAAEDMNEMEESDEGLLLELDTVDDLRVKQFGDFDNHMDFDGQILPSPKGNVVDVAQNIQENSGIEEIIFAVPETEPQSLEDIDSTFLETEVVLGDPWPSHIDREVDEASDQSEVKMQMESSESKLLKDFDLDISQLSEENMDRTRISDLVLSAVESEVYEDSSSELHIMETASSEGINLVVSESSLEKGSKFSEEGLTGDFPNDMYKN